MIPPDFFQVFTLRICNNEINLVVKAFPNRDSVSSTKKFKMGDLFKRMCLSTSVLPRT